MSCRYKVLKQCFFNDILRTPGGKHDPVILKEKLKKCPSYLKLLKAKDVVKPDETPDANLTKAQKAAITRKANKIAKEKAAKAAPKAGKVAKKVDNINKVKMDETPDDEPKEDLEVI